MARYVIDASIALMWFVPEAHSPDAQGLLGPAHELHAPDLIFPEVGNVLRKRVSGRHMSAAEAEAVLAGLRRLPVQLHPAGGLIAPAVRLAVELQQTVYDTLYLALAQQEQARLVTADRRFHKALLAGGYTALVLRVEQFGAGEG